MPLSNPFCHIVSLQTGQSSSESATGGVDVVFTKEFSRTPNVIISPWQKDATWITAISTTGFSWEGDNDASAIDWVVIVDNE